MRSPNRQTLSKRIVDGLPVSDRETVYWDRKLPGFGVRVHPSGSKVYMVHKRSGGKSRRVTIGRHGVWSLEAARREAGGIIARLEKGETPGRPGADSPSATGPTIAELAEQYMTDHVAVRCKPTTARSCRHILNKFLLPQFGAQRLGEITPDEVATLHYRLRETPIMANQVISLLSRLFHKAAASGDAPARGNPCRFIKKYPTRSRERFLSEHEFERLGVVLRELETGRRISKSAAAALRLLMLTGCRRNEILTLRWEHVDLEHDEIRLRQAKTGARAVPLSPTARRVLTKLPRQAESPWVFPGRETGTRLANLNTSWQVVRKEAGLEDVRIHDLRHSFASRALALGESLPMIGKLLGHRQVQTTARYAHLARHSVKAAARRIEDSLAADMDMPSSVSEATGSAAQFRRKGLLWT